MIENNYFSSKKQLIYY